MNPAYSRHGSETESNSSDMDNNRDISPPRVRRPRGGRDNQAFSNDSSYEDSSSVDDEKVDGTYTVEDEKHEKKTSGKSDRRNDTSKRDTKRTNQRGGILLLL